MSAPLVLPFAEIRASDLPMVGGKGANLGELAAAGFPVPSGFCVTTAAYRAVLAAIPEMDRLFQALDALHPEDLAATRAGGARVRETLEAAPLPPEVTGAVLTAWRAAGTEHAYAVRSSATAEDLPGASFAGQQDTWLNVRGEAALLDRVRACMASLFTDRAILYRARGGFGHRAVALSVVVQRMVQAEVAGILFTADPVNGHRGICSIDAGFGLGEALVGGLVNADLVRVDRAAKRVVETRVGEKRLAIRPLPGGGTERVALSEEEQRRPALTEAQALALAELGGRVEAHFGAPQDIEWCIAGGALFLVQTRPITTLFPLPAPPPTDGALHLYVSFGHVQVMTDPLSPLGCALWRLALPFGKRRGVHGPSPLVSEAGGRLYIDITPLLRREWFRRRVPVVVERVDPLIGRILAEAAARPSFGAGRSEGAGTDLLPRVVLPVLARLAAWLFLRSPDRAVARITSHLDRAVDQARAAIAAAPPGAARLRVAGGVCEGLIWGALPILPIVASGIGSGVLLSTLLRGVATDADLAALGRGLQGNVTTEMDLAVGDLADAARGSPAVRDALLSGTLDPAALAKLPGGAEFQAALDGFLARYGMRGPSEIDIARPRYREQPAALLQFVAGNLRTAEAGSHRVHYARLMAEGEAAAARVEAAAGALGWVRRALVRRVVRVHRSLMAMREHPKFMLIRVFGTVREAVVQAGEALVAQGRLERASDAFLLRLEELIAALESPDARVRPLVEERRATQARFATLVPPRVLTSEGEAPVAHHEGVDLPVGALVGASASGGVVEGIARVVLDPASEALHKGEILIAPFTDPGWTPLFINAAGLVMEVGGLMTHGSVVAREYGIPAVVSVPGCTRKIHTGDRVRVDGDRGFVEILPAAEG